jgi:hypothetical protein
LRGSLKAERTGIKTAEVDVRIQGDASGPLAFRILIVVWTRTTVEGLFA